MKVMRLFGKYVCLSFVWIGQLFIVAPIPCGGGVAFGPCFVMLCAYFVLGRWGRED